MEIEDFVKRNWEEIDTYIRGETGSNDALDNEERELWVMNDQFLYRWAQEEGAHI